MSPLPRRSRPPPTPPLFHGYLRSISRPHDVFLNMSREYGDFVRWRGLYVLYFVNHPDFVREILSPGSESFSKDLLDYRVLATYLGYGMICADGDEWHRQRTSMQPFFAGLNRFDDTINSFTSSFLSKWESRVHGETVWLDRELDHLTAQIASTTVLGQDSDRDFENLIAELPVLNKTTRDPRSVLRLQPWIPTRHNLAINRIRKQTDRFVYKAIAARRREESGGDDILSWLIHAAEETSSPRGDEQIRDEVITFLLSSQVPTTNAAIWTLYLLAANPRIQDQLADSLTGSLKGAPATASDLLRIPLLKRVVQESMRLYPPLWIIPRKAERAREFGGFRLPAGAYVSVVPYALHRHPEFWPDPERFDPNRFLPSNVKNRHFYSYIPFGAGPRTCIGAGLAMRQVQMILAQIIQRFRIRMPNAHPVDVQGGIALTPRYGIPATLTPR